MSVVLRSGQQKQYDIAGLSAPVTRGMVLVLSKANVRSADPILPLKIQNSNAFNGFFAVVGCFRALLSRTTSGVLSCAPRTQRHAGGGSYHQHTPRTAPPRPVWPQTCFGVSAAGAGRWLRSGHERSCDIGQSCD